MGPYCNFCGQRCFVHFPEETPDYVLKAYGTSAIIATCQGGQTFERRMVGFCYDDIQSIIGAERTGRGIMVIDTNHEKPLTIHAVNINTPDEYVARLGLKPIVITPRDSEALGHNFDWPFPLTHISVADWSPEPDNPAIPTA